MKSKVSIITILIVLSLPSINNIYGFQFGFGTRGFVKKVIEEG